jgi:CHAD domain-containing protein
MSKPPRLDLLVRRRTRILAEHLDGALSGDARAVHQARVATRRLREVIPVVSTGLTHVDVRKLKRGLRRVTRALGPVREADVALETLDEFSSQATISEGAASRVAELLEERREQRRSDMQHRLRPRRLERINERAEALARTLYEAAPSSLWAGALTVRLESRGLTLRSAIDEAGALYSTDRLHAVRIAVKKLRYGLELAGDTRIVRTGAMVTRLKNFQDLLGRLHDLEMLAEYTRTTENTSGPSDTSGLQHLIESLERECRHLHAEYVRRQATLIRLVDSVLDEAVPKIGAVASMEFADSV